MTTVDADQSPVDRSAAPAGWPRRAKTLARRVSSRTRRSLLSPFVRVQHQEALVRLGSPASGWWVPVSVLRPDAIAYCAGAGEDISFDLGLHERGLRVVTVDPTPRAIAYVRSVDPGDERFRFVPVGLWDQPAELRFYAPSNDGVSHSVINLQGTSAHEGFTARVDSLAALMAAEGHDHIDLLKVDIEGAESTVLPHLLRHGPHPQVVCFEYDQPQSSRALLRLLRQFDAHGYRLVCREKWNFTLDRTAGEPPDAAPLGSAGTPAT